MERVSDSVCPTLDPSNITGDDVLIERNNESITVSDVEREFSLCKRWPEWDYFTN